MDATRPLSPGAAVWPRQEAHGHASGDPARLQLVDRCGRDGRRGLTYHTPWAAPHGAFACEESTATGASKNWTKRGGRSNVYGESYSYRGPPSLDRVAC